MPRLLAIAAASAVLATGAAPSPAPRVVFYTEHSCSRGLGACGNGELAVVAADGSHYRRLTRNRVTERHPSWSADHRLIVYDRGSPSHIWVMNADGSHQHPLRLSMRSGERLLEPAWSPDGARVAASVWTGTTFRVFVFDLRTGGRKRLPAAVEAEREPEWSPDGTRIAFTGYRVRRGLEVVISSVDGPRWWAMAGCTAECSSPSWSPDGTAHRIQLQRRRLRHHAGRAATGRHTERGEPGVVAGRPLARLRGGLRRHLRGASRRDGAAPRGEAFARPDPDQPRSGLVARPSLPRAPSWSRR